MKRVFHDWRNWLWCFLSGAVLPSYGQGYYYQRLLQQEDPQWFKFNLQGGSLGIYNEDTFEKNTGAGSSSDYSRYFVGPEIGLNGTGSIYHPNLVQFSTVSDGALGQSWYNSGGTRSSQLEWLGNGLAAFNFLGAKPYASTASASVTHTYTQYNFFGQSTVDTYRYGFQTGYQQDNWPVHLSYWHTQQDNAGSGPSGTYTTDQDVLNFDAANRRANGGSRFVYTLTDYSQNGSGINSSGLNQSWGVGDTEYLGVRRNMTLNTDANYSLLDSPGNSGTDANAYSTLNVKHTDSLFSTYNANYGRSTYGPDTSDNYAANASLQHQLYQSLSSGISVNYNYGDSQGPGGSSSTSTYGVGLGEGYTKKIGDWARLNVSVGGGYSQSDTTQSGNSVPVNNEPHSFPGIGIPVALQQPDVNVPSIQVYKDSGHTVLYPEAGNYTVTQNGQITYLTLLAGSIIPPNTTVYISYTYSNSGNGSGSYDTTDEFFQVRMNMWNGLLGVYGRVYSIQNSGSAGLVLNNSTQYALGADSVWRFFRVGAEYDLYDSSFSTYNSARLYQTMVFHPDRVSTLSFGFNESWTFYSNSQGNLDIYSFISRYHRALASCWALDLEGGVSQQTGLGGSQTLFNARPGLEFAKGRFSVKLSYDFEYSDYSSANTYYYQTLFLRIRRSF